MSSEIPTYYDFSDYFHSNKTRCMTFEETKFAISSGDAVVSGFYGPGAYLAWLITAWVVAISSIASAKCASNNPKKTELDLELIVVISYPLIAAIDIFVRLIRCDIDASMTAAVFVLLSSLSILSPMKRLSIQQEGGELFEYMDNMSSFWTNKRLLIIRIPRWIGYSIVGSIIGEAYANLASMETLWALQFVTILYSGAVGKYRVFKGHYSVPFRPWKERVAFFCIVQIVFTIVLVTTGSRNFMPITSTSLFDLDQATALLVAIVTLVLSRREGLKNGFRKVIRRIKGRFSRDEEEADIALLSSRNRLRDWQ